MPHSIIGKPLPMTDAPAKVTGLGKYTDDLAVPGMLFGRILPNSIPGTAKSSVYLPRPVTFAGESVMGSGLPMMEYGAKGQSPTGAGWAARDAVRSMASFTDS